MWQDNFAIETFADRSLALVIVDSQGYDVSDHPGNSPGMEAAHCQNTSKNSIFISAWKVCAADHQA